MTNDPVSEQGRMTAYVDQNILDLFVKDKALGFKKILIEKFQVLYSDETLNEIKRSGSYSNKFLNALVELNAAYIKIHLDENFLPAGSAHIWLRNPHEVFAEYCEPQPEVDAVQDAIAQFLLKFSGGRVGDETSDINEEQKEAFSELMESIKEMASDLDAEIPGLKDMLELHSDIAEEQHNKSLNEFESLLSQDIEDEENWSGIKDFREGTGIGPLQLKNIHPPNVLEQIWTLYKDSLQEDEINIDIDDFFCISKNLINPEQPLYQYQKVTMIYHMLNTIGYFPDSKIHKERRFIASMSDQGHATVASFTHALFSGDEDLIKKSAAAYEYLNIPTQAVHVAIDKEPTERISNLRSE